MNLATVTAIRTELAEALVGRRVGKIFQLTKSELAIDFRLADSRYLFLSTDSKNPRAYLIRRKIRELEKASGQLSNFAQLLRKNISSFDVSAVTQVTNERVLKFSLTGENDLGESVALTLVAQLTGASANLFLLDASSVILGAMRQTLGDGQQIGERYEPPVRRSGDAAQSAAIDPAGLSDRLDAEDQTRRSELAFQSLAGCARAKLKQERTKREKLLGKLAADLEDHGDAERWKRFGDLLLANTASARRENGQVFVTDFFDDSAPEISIEVDENDSITEAAEKFFRRYTKARNAQQEIEKRRETLGKELERFRLAAEDLELAIDAGDEEKMAEITGVRRAASTAKVPTKRPEETSGTRSFVSPDGFEILVGKKAKDNDYLTFRIAKSLDTWMHAADYPGSHVVIRNPNRKEIPHATLIEAAQLAAFYSQGKKQPKAAVHYTQKKFVNKPKGAAPGLVSLASFKTLLVEPKVGKVRMNDQ